MELFCTHLLCSFVSPSEPLRCNLGGLCLWALGKECDKLKEPLVTELSEKDSDLILRKLNLPTN